MALLMNTLMIGEYFCVTAWYINGGYFSFGFWIAAYATFLATVSYIAVLFIEPGSMRAEVYADVPIPPYSLSVLSPNNLNSAGNEHSEINERDYLMYSTHVSSPISPIHTGSDTSPLNRNALDSSTSLLSQCVSPTCETNFGSFCERSV
jgi:hypothetical protein